MDACIIDMANTTKYSSFQNRIVTIFVKVLPVVGYPKTQEPLLRMWKLNPNSYPYTQIITDLRPILITPSHLSLTLHFSYSINILYLFLCPCYTCRSTNFISTWTKHRSKLGITPSLYLPGSGFKSGLGDRLSRMTSTVASFSLYRQMPVH